jgi:hypothetical protein
MNAYQRMTLAEENFNNQVGRMTHPLDTSEPPSLATLLLLNRYMNKVAMMAEMGVIHGFSKMNFHPPRPTGLDLLQKGQCASSRKPTLSPRDGTIPQRDQPATCICSQLTSNSYSKIFASSHNFMLCWSGRLGSRGRDVSP